MYQDSHMGSITWHASTSSTDLTCGSCELKEDIGQREGGKRRREPSVKRQCVITMTQYHLPYMVISSHGLG